MTQNIKNLTRDYLNSLTGSYLSEERKNKIIKINSEIDENGERVVSDYNNYGMHIKDYLKKYGEIMGFATDKYHLGNAERYDGPAYEEVRTHTYEDPPGSGNYSHTHTSLG
nr:5879_t:CDS:2 [Entrophospora candida]